ncbi:DUF2513 domain-containing protein [Lacticaseibacillus paracasei]|uniref:DUF2513 domain-containing protein n=1 Tax=Lacticaseibacillus paracasei TaxID=1597 RepID=UPI0021A8B476|nr:DUF2513 domain-containing protein [Lacticaseibacillus paracasei]MCT4385313.1 hypothetical protein [Lacticaseibacillus paracasei]
MDYFYLYELVLKTVNTERPTDGFALIKDLEKLEPVKRTLLAIGDDRRARQDFTNDTIDTLVNLISDGLIVGRITTTNMGKLFIIDRLSTAGHKYLDALSKPAFKEKVKAALRSQGVPVTIAAITKAITELIP